ncbi:uncharacterized protein MRET_2372 [Malassezia restricta]|uniref:uncharacterized protein n=1 Tax=Malassezia restricta TaxID=76775 RepID=UPI000DD0F928|nr:uncharacterized protein MRET_2372 [Malassezia restricta]AXA50425.1 uncharacterized protein MRET_2372 [Malassezia restricta]
MPRQEEGPESARYSWKDLATSQAFTDALRRDVHILVDAFALTWIWLDTQPQPDTPSSSFLRWEYGPFTVFERVWIRNHWHHASSTLGTYKAIRRDFSDMVIRAFLDELAPVSAPQDTTSLRLLHAVGAAFGLACWWYAQPPGTYEALPLDTEAYRALIELPERARTVLDGEAHGHRIPPSSDMAYVVQQLLSGPYHVYVVPLTSPRLCASTTLHAKAHAWPEATGAMDALGIPGATSQAGASANTAQALENLSLAQTNYAARHVDVSWQD